MSHLSLDARAILQHLNELGYRNISAEQLREFLKGMQPQSDKQSASKSKLATAKANPQQQQHSQQPQPELQQQQQQPPPPHRSKVKVIKSKRPLCHFKFYLDICDHQLTNRIEAEIKALGGTLEFFLNDSITHFITDKDRSTTSLSLDLRSRNNSQQPSTPKTPQTPNTTPQDDGSGIQRWGRQTRADAILSRVRAAQQQTEQQLPQHQLNNNNNNHNKNKESCGNYTIWKTEYALRFFRRIQTELRQYLVQGGSLGGAIKSGGGSSANIIQLKGNFIKIETIKRNNRPYYHLLKQPEEWPKIDLCSEDSAFRLHTKAAHVQSMTRKSLGSRSSQRQQEKETLQQKTLQTPQTQPLPLQHAAVQALKKKQTAPDSPRSHCRDQKESSDKQCGVCEICKIEYDTLTIHLQSKEHELFAKNAHNFLALDKLIQVSASVDGFLEREQKQQPPNENDDMDVDELHSNSDISINNNKSLNQSKIDANAQKLNLSGSNNNNNNNRQRPSPALREKSKRITKGKHYSEKFRATPNTSPGPQTPPSPNMQTTPVVAGNLPEQSTTTTVTRRKTQNSVLSPPIRAMLPPSSLYKVVETNDGLTTTTPRMRRGGANNTNVLDSPSLIVKFQKVRQSELQRLNGEAENFMFPRTTTTTRSSSELATDVDRQTTSDVVRCGGGHTSISSVSLDSTSEDAELPTATITTTVTPGKRATVVGRRRMGVAQRKISTGSSSSNNGLQQQQQQQRFPIAPIQPEMQQSQQQLLKLKKQQRQSMATRKSSRTATAIVTAATTSNQLQLRRRTETTAGGRVNSSSKRGGNLEDRMGEQTVTKKKNENLQQTTATDNEDDNNEEEIEEEEVEADEEENNDAEDRDDDDDEEEEESSSSGSDEDYVANGKLLNCSMPPTTPSRLDTREERAARRLSRLTVYLKQSVEKEKQKKIIIKSPTRRCGKIKQNKPTTPTTTSTMTTTNATSTTDLIYDWSKSEHLQKLRYAFEELPGGDLWHRVFQRQDAGEEHYYSYYGTTCYRKLPYELGPIPMERTSSHSCTMCQRKLELEQEVVKTEKIKLEKRDVETATTATTKTPSSTYKHKKLHLLQRYQQEQQQQHQQALNTAIMPVAKCDSKASTPELLEREFASINEQRAQNMLELVRAASTQSNTSSSCSNSQKSGMTSCRNKQLARIAELPPRKSPREHASTLALVSCIIRQRQDSQSKTNSEAEELPPPTTTPTAATVTTKLVLKKEPHNTRSQAVTPVEELRFATEISETVKRMRRGQNKYDNLPPITTTTTPRIPPTRCRRPTAAAAAAAASYSRRLEATTKAVGLLAKRNKRLQLTNATTTSGMRSGGQQQPTGLGLVAGVRKLPSKKGILEYEMESSALKQLDASRKYVNPFLIAWQIDKFLELTGREYDPSADDADDSNEIVEYACANANAQTPPPTEGCCFSSDFDLCDLLGDGGSAASGDDDAGLAAGRRNNRINLYCSYQRKRKCLKSNRTGWPRAQRRRGTAARLLPGERVSCRRRATGPTTVMDEKLLSGLKHETLEIEEEPTTTTTTTTTNEIEIGKEKDDDNADEDDSGSGDHADADLHADGDVDEDEDEADKKKTRSTTTATRENVVMTPPATDVDDEVGSVNGPNDNDNDDDDEDDDNDNETMADSIEEQLERDVEIDATDADVEEDDDDDDDVDNDDDDVYKNAYGDDNTKHDHKLNDEPTEKRARITYNTTPAKNTADNKKSSLLTLQITNGYHHHHHHRLSATSTPSTQQQSRTPQMNGSLGSCISPSEKLGDNSDIFTVSSDGLDTDMDLSNTQAGDSLDHCTHQTTTPKRKFDISKYAPPNNGKAASSCAAEAAATAAVKSLAISQFLKKEVRVTCRRLRAPFRRFRYRR